MKTKMIYLTLAVKVPEETSPGEVADLINMALDEPPCDWGNWTVGTAVLVEKP